MENIGKQFYRSISRNHNLWSLSFSINRDIYFYTYRQKMTTSLNMKLNNSDCQTNEHGLTSV